MQEVVGDLKEDIKATEDEAQRVSQQLQHAEKAINAADNELRQSLSNLTRNCGRK